MKTFFKMVNKLWYMLLCSIVVSCSDSPDLPVNPSTPNPEPEPEPEPVEQNYCLKNGVNEIKGDNLDYIVEAIEGSTLVLSENYPSDELPVVGEIIYVNPNQKLPHGFLGKVSEITQLGGNYNMATEAVALDEAFSYLSVDETIDMELYAGEEIADSRVAYENINGYQCLSQNIKGEIQLLNHMKVGSKGKLTYGLRIRNVADIDSATNKKYLRIDISQYMAFDAEAHFSIVNDDKKWTKETELVKLLEKPIIEPRIPAGVISFFASPKIEVNLVAQLEAALSLGLGCEFVCERTNSVIYDNGQWKVEESPTNEIESSSFNFLPIEIKVEGSEFYGVSVSPNISLFNRRDMKIEVTLATGPKFQAELNYNPKEDKSIYEALKDDMMGLYWAFVGEAKASANIFKKELEWTLPIFDWTSKKGIECYIFPDFTDCKIKEIEENKHKIASTSLKRDIAFSTPVGIAAYDANDSILFKMEPVDYRLENDFKDKNPIEMKYENMEDADYSIWTYVKWGDTYVKCKSFALIVGIWMLDYTGTKYDGVSPEYYVISDDGNMDLYFEYGTGDGYHLAHGKWEFEEPIFKFLCVDGVGIEQLWRIKFESVDKFYRDMDNSHSGDEWNNEFNPCYRLKSDSIIKTLTIIGEYVEVCTE